MITVGITGGIGSGKTIICKVFKQLNVPVYNADSEAKILIANNKEVQSKIADTFGENIFQDGELDRKKLADIVFSDSVALKKLNDIVHPAVNTHFQTWLRSQTHPYVIKEAAILFESGSYKLMNYTITVTAPESLRIQRVMKRDNITQETVKKRMENQMSDQEKLKRSDFVIYNDDKQLVLPQVIELDKKFKTGL